LKRLSLTAAGAALALSAVLVANALRLTPAPRGGPAPAVDPAIDAAAAAGRLAEAIRFRTISHQDPAQDDPVPFDGLRGFLERAYPKAHGALTRELVGRALLFTWRGSDAAAAPILLMAHGDVVPVEAGSESVWAHPPFDGTIADGFVWGRGALDDKGSLIGILEAVEALVSSGYQPKRTVYLLFGLDEEVGGREGAKRVAALLAERKVRLAWVLDEGGAVSRGIIPTVPREIIGISVTEKGYVSVELLVKGAGGHSSMPPPATTIGRLAAAVARLEGMPMPTGLVEPTRTTMRLLGAEMGFTQRLLLGNLWLTSPLVTQRLAASTATNPMVRTTTAPTIFEAGVKENVLPAQARAVVNFRLLPGDSVNEVLQHVRDVVVDDAITITALPTTITDAAPVSRMDSAGFRIIAAAASRAFPDAVVVPAMVNGATDSRHLTPVADDIYRFVPRLMLPEDLPRLHGANERMSVEGLARSIAVYREILEKGSS
jgi:carboxypeptidase PM20D1